jgi:hypothetical protein
MVAMRKNWALGLGYSVYEPTSKDIRRACEEIQATWSPQDRAKRDWGPRAVWWSPPTIRLSDLVEAVNGARADSPLDVGAAGNEAER